MDYIKSETLAVDIIEKDNLSEKFDLNTEEGQAKAAEFVTNVNNLSVEARKKLADTYAARAGYSEHQTGLAIDVFNDKEAYTNFEETKEYLQYSRLAHYGYDIYTKNHSKATGIEKLCE